MLWFISRWVGRETGLPPVLGKEWRLNIKAVFAYSWIRDSCCCLVYE